MAESYYERDLKRFLTLVTKTKGNHAGGISKSISDEYPEVFSRAFSAHFFLRALLDYLTNIF